jgi:hypothetical protein
MLGEFLDRIHRICRMKKIRAIRDKAFLPSISHPSQNKNILSSCRSFSFHRERFLLFEIPQAPIIEVSSYEKYYDSR